MKVFIPHVLPGLNEIIAANRKHRMVGAAQKKTYTDLLTLIFRTELKEFERPIFINFTWCEKDRRRDPDNIAAGKKFIFDALVKAGCIKNDGWSQIQGWEDNFIVSYVPGVVVEINEVLPSNKFNK